MMGTWFKDFPDFALTKGAKIAVKQLNPSFSSKQPAVLTLCLEGKMQASAFE